MSKKAKEVSLVLGSGGARGLAHIGVIRWLEENGLAIKSISGCSMGALVGGIYAAGKLDDFEEWVRAIKKTDMISLLDIAWNRGGLVKGDKIISTLKDLVGDRAIEELPIKFTAVATDLKEEKEVWMNSGPLFDAIRASVSLPFFFTPFNYKGIEVVDGGVLNPVPIAPTFNDNLDLTLAVNLGGKIDKHIDQQYQKAEDSEQETETKQPPSEFSEKIKKFILNLSPENNGEEPKTQSDIFDIANQSFDAMQGAISRHKLASYPADYTAIIPRNACGAMDFDCADRMIEIGYRKAEETFDFD